MRRKPTHPPTASERVGKYVGGGGEGKAAGGGEGKAAGGGEGRAAGGPPPHRHMTSCTSWTSRQAR